MVKDSNGAMPLPLEVILSEENHGNAGASRIKLFSQLTALMKVRNASVEMMVLLPSEEPETTTVNGLMLMKPFSWMSLL